MAITGHKTDTIFRRYNITDDRDKAHALDLLGGYRQSQPQQSNVIQMAK